MGIDTSFGKAFAKAEIAAGQGLPLEGSVFISVNNRDKRSIIFIAKSLDDMGFEIFATEGTGEVLNRAGVEVRQLLKIHEGRPNVIDLIKKGKINLIINTPWGKGPRTDGYYIRTAASFYGVPCITTISAAQAAIQGIEAMKFEETQVKAIQEYHENP